MEVTGCAALIGATIFTVFVETCVFRSIVCHEGDTWFFPSFVHNMDNTPLATFAFVARGLILELAPQVAPKGPLTVGI